MKKDIQRIVKSAAERYGLGYNPDSEHATVLQNDGSIKTLQLDDLANVFNVTSTSQSWVKAVEEVKWSNEGLQINLGEDLSYDINMASSAVA